MGKFYPSQPLVDRGPSLQIAWGEIAGGVSDRETLKDVFETICRILQGALQITIKLLRGQVQHPIEAFIQYDTLE